MKKNPLTRQQSRLKEAIAELPPGRARRYPAHLQRDIAAYGRSRMAAGGTLAAVCRELDIGSDSLKAALRRHRPSPQVPTRLPGRARRPLRQVRVTDAAPTMASSPSAPGRGLVVRLPGDISVEGLDVSGVVSLLRSLP